MEMDTVTKYGQTWFSPQEFLNNWIKSLNFSRSEEMNTRNTTWLENHVEKGHVGDQIISREDVCVRACVYLKEYVVGLRSKLICLTTTAFFRNSSEEYSSFGTQGCPRKKRMMGN
jgi:hypothetical protein